MKVSGLEVVVDMVTTLVDPTASRVVDYQKNVNLIISFQPLFFIPLYKCCILLYPCKVFHSLLSFFYHVPSFL